MHEFQIRYLCWNISMGQSIAGVSGRASHININMANEPASPAPPLCGRPRAQAAPAHPHAAQKSLRVSAHILRTSKRLGFLKRSSPDESDLTFHAFLFFFFFSF